MSIIDTFGLTVDNNWLVMLAELTLKGSLLLVIALAVTLSLRNASASLRYLVWTAALVGMAAIPALSYVLPQWSVPLLPKPTRVLSNSDARSTTLGSVRPAAPTAPTTLDLTAPSESRRFTSTVAVDARASAGAIPASGKFARKMTPLALLWLAGSLVCLLIVVLSNVGLRVVTRGATPLEDSQWARLLLHLKGQLGIHRNVVLLRSDRTSMPATWGLRQSVILLPAEAVDWPDEMRRVVLLHELAHVKRNDCLTQLFAQVCCAFYWFHPGVWYIARRMRSERELACDETVIALGVDACDYAGHLLDIARLFRTPPATSVAAIAMARRSQLEGRLLAILNGSAAGRQQRGSFVARSRILAVMAIATLPLAAMRPWRDATPAAGKVGPTETAAAAADNVPAGTLEPVVTASDTIRWRGALEPGQWIEIHANVAEILGVLAPGREAEIIAVNRSGKPIMSGMRLTVDRKRKGIEVCVLPIADGRASCDDAFMKHTPTNTDRIDFLVRVPRGVGFAGHTVRGNVAAEGLESYVWGTSRKGDISLETSDLAEASTDSGDISGVIGRANWTENLEFETGSGAVTVVAPSNANAMYQAETDRGRVTTEFPIANRSNRAGDHVTGRIGASNARGFLTLRTGRGDVVLRRGPQGRIAPDLYSNAPSADPKPNPNPDPGIDPNPNDDLNPNPYPSPSFRGPGSRDADATDDPENPTGERVSVRIPSDLVDRFSDAALASAPDRAAIVRLRDIALTHRKQHAADLVRERSLWALSLVNGGSIVRPLIDALRDPDWRVRAYAAWALSESGDPRALPALASALRDQHWRVRMHAVYGLEIGGSSSVPALIDALRDPYWQVRIGAVDALTTIGDQRAVAPLRAIARDNHPLVRQEVAAALGKLEQ